ncbi:MAG: PBSX family phage terminase large subunit [Gammaproteobacteria bacterium]
MTAVLEPQSEIKMQFPRKFLPVLTSKKRVIVLVGGRGSAKSTSVGQFLLSLIKGEGSDILCGREFQTSIEDSVHKLVLSIIDRLGIGGVTSTDKKIDFDNGGKIRYKGFARNSSAVRSAEGYKRSWIEEAQYLSDESIKDLTPTIRVPGSQLIFTANLMASTDPFSLRFIMPFWKELKRDGFYEDDMHLIIMMNWRDNPWFPEGMEMERQWDLKHRSRAEYDHIWEGQFNDTVEGSIIKAEWFDAAIDAHIKLGFEPKGFKIVSHDPSDTGPDAKGLYYRHGSVIMDVMEKSDGDVNEGCDWATEYAIQVGADMFTWDCDGLGVTLKRQVTQALGDKNISINMFKGSMAPINPKEIYQPDSRLVPGQARSNDQTFKNRRAQYYTRLRDRFYATYLAVEKGTYLNPDDMISVSSSIQCMAQFRSEICRIPKKNNPNGLIQIMTKEEMKRLHRIESPNLADSAMMGEEHPTFKEENFNYSVPNRASTGW